MADWDVKVHVCHCKYALSCCKLSLRATGAPRCVVVHQCFLYTIFFTHVKCLLKICQSMHTMQLHSVLSVMMRALVVRTWLSYLSVVAQGKRDHMGGSQLPSMPLQQPQKNAGQALYITVNFVRLEISVVDQKPEEVLAATLVGLKLESASGIGPDGSFSSLRFSFSGIQLDDMLPTTR